jgi:TRAP-type C4-dicarboxylate transport system permease small subunit
MWSRLRTGFERLLEIIVALLMVALVVVVVLGVVYRKAGHSLSWYDEIASILLAWLTYYGAALAAYKRAHIGFSGIVDATPPPWRLAIVIFAELCIISFFALLAWMGVVVLDVLVGDTLVSLPQIGVEYTQSVIPIGAVLFIIGQLASLPEVLREARVHTTHHPKMREP